MRAARISVIHDVTKTFARTLVIQLSSAQQRQAHDSISKRFSFSPSQYGPQGPEGREQKRDPLSRSAHQGRTIHGLIFQQPIGNRQQLPGQCHYRRPLASMRRYLAVPATQAGGRTARITRH